LRTNKVSYLFLIKKSKLDMQSKRSWNIVFGSLILISYVFVGCREKEDEQQSYEDAVANQVKDKIAETMDDFYFWRENIPPGINPRAFSSNASLVDAMLYKPIDKWTYTTTKAEFDALTRAGQFAGHGFVQSIDVDGNLRIGAVFKNSPAEQAGFKRSTKILAINGKSAAEILATNSMTEVIGPREVGVINNFRIQDPDGTIRDIQVPKAIVTQNTVMHHQIETIGNKKIGYLVFMAFRESSINELNVAFTDFKAAGVTDLIVDFRYNGGGFVNVAEHLANMIAPSSAIGQVLARYTFNSRQTSREENLRIGANSLNLNLQRMVAITSPGTASASELVINGLDPFMDMKLVGEQTGGKPVGAYVLQIADQVLVPITFKTVNANGVGDYYDGLIVDKQVIDGLDKGWGDPEEARYKEAVHYIVNGAFTSSASSRQLSNFYREKTINMMKGFQAEIGAY